MSSWTPGLHTEGLGHISLFHHTSHHLKSDDLAADVEPEIHEENKEIGELRGEWIGLEAQTQEWKILSQRELQKAKRDEASKVSEETSAEYVTARKLKATKGKHRKRRN
ncbi:hypothetical protein L873DRAFT_1845476 [Choiromyces venosus 120613-1]|uniref:Uncharacterized protein n=1 Tax=Choiromyces venosus 120613-1 TaxID=1336337 RepID=A0A3N4JDA2_9PEZI|nr:hypothetical protein L873DRAFT_1845476 [Choiromyces venosus 120613-1]